MKNKGKMVREKKNERKRHKTSNRKLRKKKGEAYVVMYF